MKILTISTHHPETVCALLTSEQLIEPTQIKTLNREHNTLTLYYPDDALSQALGYWLVLAQGCALIMNHQLKER